MAWKVFPFTRKPVALAGMLYIDSFQANSEAKALMICCEGWAMSKLPMADMAKETSL